MLKVAIVGCGKIADSHAAQIQRIKGCEIVGVCDRELLMAKQLYDRFPIKGYFNEVSELLDASRPDVVHITTPPAGHFELAKLCLENGCHVYVEKPFTVYEEEAQKLVEIANSKGLKLTVGHNEQFSHLALRMRALVQSGYLGGPPVHMESCYGHDLGGSNYARALRSDKQHWVRRLPGKLLQNIVSHGIAKIAEFLTTDAPNVIACGFASPLLTKVGESDIFDELRVIISDGSRTTAYFTFSTQIRPLIHEFRIYGPKNGLVLDQDHDILLRLRGKKFTSFADKFFPPVMLAKQYVGNLITNGEFFLRREFHVDAGIKNLIEAFYRSILEDGPVPIPYREILLTTRIMQSIFEQLNNGNHHNQGALEQQPVPTGMLEPGIKS